MPRNAFYELFLDELKDAFDAENQLVDALPKAIRASSHPELKDALSHHLEETRNHVTRLKNIFKALNENPTGTRCEAMEGLIQECEDACRRNVNSAVKDAGIIVACQKIEHYEISTYGSLRTLARHLNDANISSRIDFDEIADTLQQTLDEEAEADETLTEIAEGGFFTEGINEEAEKAEQPQKSSKKQSR